MSFIDLMRGKSESIRGNKRRSVWSPSRTSLGDFSTENMWFLKKSLNVLMDILQKDRW